MQRFNELAPICALAPTTWFSIRTRGACVEVGSPSGKSGCDGCLGILLAEVPKRIEGRGRSYESKADRNRTRKEGIHRC